MNLIENHKSVFVINPPSQCPLRSIDAIKIKNYFLLNNFILKDNIEESDYIVYVTCSVSPIDVENTLKTIEELKKYKAELIIMGCLPGANLSELRTSYDGVAIATKNINDIDNYFPYFRIKFNQIPEVNTFNFDDLPKTIFYGKHDYSSFHKLLLKYGLSGTFFRKYSRLKDFKKFSEANKGANVSDSSFIIVSNGCANNCSYCNIRNAVGKIKSKSLESLTKEYSELIKKGYRIFHFLADDISSYGLDLKSSLIELLNQFSEIDKNYHVKWSLHGINPAWLVENELTLTLYFETKKIWDITIADTVQKSV